MIELSAVPVPVHVLGHGVPPKCVPQTCLPPSTITIRTVFVRQLRVLLCVSSGQSPVRVGFLCSNRSLAAKKGTPAE